MLSKFSDIIGDFSDTVASYPSASSFNAHENIRLEGRSVIASVKAVGGTDDASAGAPRSDASSLSAGEHTTLNVSEPVTQLTAFRDAIEAFSDAVAEFPTGMNSASERSNVAKTSDTESKRSVIYTKPWLAHIRSDDKTALDVTFSDSELQAVVKLLAATESQSNSAVSESALAEPFRDEQNLNVARPYDAAIEVTTETTEQPHTTAHATASKAIANSNAKATSNAIEPPEAKTTSDAGVRSEASATSKLIALLKAREVEESVAAKTALAAKKATKETAARNTLIEISSSTSGAKQQSNEIQHSQLVRAGKAALPLVVVAIGLSIANIRQPDLSFQPISSPDRNSAADSEVSPEKNLAASKNLGSSKKLVPSKHVVSVEKLAPSKHVAPARNLPSTAKQEVFRTTNPLLVGERHMLSQAKATERKPLPTKTMSVAAGNPSSTLGLNHEKETLPKLVSPPIASVKNDSIQNTTIQPSPSSNITDAKETLQLVSERFKREAANTQRMLEKSSAETAKESGSATNSPTARTPDASNPVASTPAANSPTVNSPATNNPTQVVSRPTELRATLKVPGPFPSTGSIITSEYLSPNAILLVQQLNLRDKLLRFQYLSANVDKSDFASRMEALELRRNISEVLRQAEMDVNYVIAEILDEQSVYSELLGALAIERDETVAKANLSSFTINGALWTACEALSMPSARQPHFAAPAGIVGIVAGVVPSIASFYALKKLQGHAHHAGFAPNMLAKIFDKEPTACVEYPVTVWNYLDSSADGFTETRRGQLIGFWSKNIKRSTPLDVITGTSEKRDALTTNLLTTRMQMLSRLSAEVCKMNRLLNELEMALRGSKTYAADSEETSHHNF